MVRPPSPGDSAFGQGTWASFSTQYWLTDSPDGAVGECPESTPTLVVARALQLGLEHACAPQLGSLVLNAVQAARLGKVEKAAFDRLRLAGLRLPTGLPQSPLFISQLSAAATAGDAQAHHRLAALYRCKRPNPYLHEESGPVDAKYMARVAPDASARHKWLRIAGQRDLEALEALASEGDVEAMQQLAIAGDTYLLRELAERALEEGQVVEAWAWQHIALKHRHDLTKSTLAARHEGGANHGEFYDSDFGGPLFVDGEEGLELPQLTRSQKAEAKRWAQELMAAQAKWPCPA